MLFEHKFTLLRDMLERFCLLGSITLPAGTQLAVAVVFLHVVHLQSQVNLPSDSQQVSYELGPHHQHINLQDESSTSTSQSPKWTQCNAVTTKRKKQCSLNQLLNGNAVTTKRKKQCSLNQLLNGNAVTTKRKKQCSLNQMLNGNAVTTKRKKQLNVTLLLRLW